MTVAELRKVLENFGAGREVKIEDNEFGRLRDIATIMLTADDDDAKVVIFHE
jgi:hypothetical protein